MIDMPQIQSIRRMHNDGYSVSEIANATKLSRPTVRKYIEVDDFNQPTPAERKRPSKLDPYIDTILGWLEDDKKARRKQRHTAKRIYDRLRTEMGFAGSYSTVQRFVKDLRAVNGSGGFLDLVWQPASIQVDFGQADFYIMGTLTCMHYLVVTFPYSNVALAQLFKGENAECVCEGLRRIFEYVGGVPDRAVFDNATGIGKRVCDEIRLTELFSRFQLHYGFTVTFCNVNSGHEKGSVENAVGTLRRNLFVPVPDIQNVAIYNKNLLGECMGRAVAVHYRKGEQCRALFEEDAWALAPLPQKPFACVRYQGYKTDGYGTVIVGGHHRYSTSPGMATSTVTVAFGADDVWVYDATGSLIAEHVRLYGEEPKESVDPSSSLRTLLRRPGAWKNSQVRASLPDALRNHIDAQDRDMVKECLATLAEVSASAGYDMAVKASWGVYQRTGQMRLSDVSLYAARLTGPGVADYEDDVDLNIYDQVFAATGAAV
jgi:transposase